MRHAILPRMSSYRVMHTDYIHTHVHTLSTIYVHMAGRRCLREECLLFSLARKELEAMAHAHAGRDGMIMKLCEGMHRRSVNGGGGESMSAQ